MKAIRLLVALFVLGLSMAASAAQMPRFDALEQRLKIRPEQKQQFDLAVGATKRALLAVGLSAMEMQQRLGEELMKARPDFSRLTDSYERIVDQHRPLFREASDEWRRLNAILDDRQVEIVKDFLRQELGRFLSAAIPDSR